MKTRLDAARIILKRLSPNEKLLWCGRPCSKLRISISDAYRMGTGIVWCAANLFMLFTFYLKTEGSAMFICLAVFALFFSYGLYMIFSSFTQKSSRRKSAVYAVTSKRVIFAKVDAGGNIKKMESIPLERTEEGNMISGKNGVGTITFWSTATNQRYRNSNWAFYDIENCEKVWEILQRAKEAKENVRSGGGKTKEKFCRQ